MAGVSLLGNDSYVIKYGYIPYGGFEKYTFAGGKDISWAVRPTGHVMINLNLMKHVMLAAGTTYRHISTGFRPLSFHVTAGFKW